jgi:DNA-directed RNA polymerase subunit RPC12/RpoP
MSDYKCLVCGENVELSEGDALTCPICESEELSAIKTSYITRIAEGREFQIGDEDTLSEGTYVMIQELDDGITAITTEDDDTLFVATEDMEDTESVFEDVQAITYQDDVVSEVLDSNDIRESLMSSFIKEGAFENISFQGINEDGDMVSVHICHLGMVAVGSKCVARENLTEKMKMNLMGGKKKKGVGLIGKVAGRLKPKGMTRAAARTAGTMLKGKASSIAKAGKSVVGKAAKSLTGKGTGKVATKVHRAKYAVKRSAQSGTAKKVAGAYGKVKKKVKTALTPVYS